MKKETNIEKLILRIGSKYMLAAKKLKILTGEIMAGDIRLDSQRGCICMNKKRERILNAFKGVQKDRLTKILSGSASFEERKMFYSNYFISVKFILRDYFKLADKYNYLSDSYAKQIAEAKKEDDLVLLRECRMLDKRNKEQINEFMKVIGAASDFLYVALQKCEGLFTDHEIAQIFSCSPNRVQEARKKYEILKRQNKISGGFLFNSVCNFNIENRDDYRTRRIGLEDCPSYEIPFFATIILGNPGKVLES